MTTQDEKTIHALKQIAFIKTERLGETPAQTLARAQRYALTAIDDLTTRSVLDAVKAGRNKSHGHAFSACVICAVRYVQSSASGNETAADQSPEMMNKCEPNEISRLRAALEEILKVTGMTPKDVISTQRGIAYKALSLGKD